MTVAVVIGGTRSGKSAHAERLAAQTGLAVRYVATASSAEGSMADRIAAHVARRPLEWETVEAGDDLHAAVSGAECALVDGLGVWIAGVLHRGNGDAAGTVREQVAALAAAPARHVIVVAEEAGQGVVPPDALSRRWLDLLGEATQTLSDAADTVDLVVAGRAIALPRTKGDSPLAFTGGVESVDRLRKHGDTDVRPGDADHAVNVLAGGPPAWLRAALHEALDRGAARYPSEARAVEAVAALHGRAPEEIVVTNGSAEALWLLPAAVRPRLAACVHPGFTESEAALRAHGVDVVRVLRDPDRDFALDPDGVPEEADLVIVGNPASPSGTLEPAESLHALRRPGRVVVVDEAFMSLVPGEPGSLVRKSVEDVVVVRTLTKAFGLAGIRAGYAVAGPRLAARLRAVRPPWSANALALAALIAVAARPQSIAVAARRVQDEREDLARRLAPLDGVRAWPSAANYVLIEVADGPRVVAALREQKIAVRPCETFPGLGPNHIRITPRDAAANARLVEALAAAC